VVVAASASGWKPALEQAHGPGVYPLFEGLVEKLRRVQVTDAASYPRL
jgi:hypothetical protein